uniref:Putative secreted protein n=1 Tax=Anopheles marajoara TaxID=58244 RepID=A0A2M4C8E4_9DIPT
MPLLSPSLSCWLSMTEAILFTSLVAGQLLLSCDCYCHYAFPVAASGAAWSVFGCGAERKQTAKRLPICGRALCASCSARSQRRGGLERFLEASRSRSREQVLR